MPNVNMTPELETAVRAASSTADITAAIEAELARQTGAADAELAATAAKAAADKAMADREVAATTVTRTEVIGGREFTFSGSSQSEVDQLVLNAYRVAYAVGSGTQEVQADPAPEVVDTAAIQAATDAETARQTELGLKFQRGEISVKEYLEESGAVSEYLEREGISIAELKETVQKTQDSTYAQDWQNATATFLAGPGAEWPGGDANKINLQNALFSLNLMDADDKVGALVTAYEYLKQHDALKPFVPPVSDAQAAPGAAADAAAYAEYTADGAQPVIPQTPEALQAVIHAAVQKALSDQTAATAAAIEAAKRPRGSSSMFGASSGVSGSGVGAGSTESRVRSDAAATAALKDASPAEIMAAWKEAQMAGGKDANEVFMNAFRRPA